MWRTHSCDWETFTLAADIRVWRWEDNLVLRRPGLENLRGFHQRLHYEHARGSAFEWVELGARCPSPEPSSARDDDMANEGPTNTTRVFLPVERPPPPSSLSVRLPSSVGAAHPVPLATTDTDAILEDVLRKALADKRKQAIAGPSSSLAAAPPPPQKVTKVVQRKTCRMMTGGRPKVHRLLDLTRSKAGTGSSSAAKVDPDDIIDLTMD